MNIDRMKRMFGDDWKPQAQVSSNVVILEDLGDSVVVRVRNPHQFEGIFCDNRIILRDGTSRPQAE
jgi:hypothetical protein